MRLISKEHDKAITSAKFWKYLLKRDYKVDKNSKQSESIYIELYTKNKLGDNYHFIESIGELRVKIKNLFGLVYNDKTMRLILHSFEWFMESILECVKQGSLHCNHGIPYVKHVVKDINIYNRELLDLLPQNVNNGKLTTKERNMYHCGSIDKMADFRHISSIGYLPKSKIYVCKLCFLFLQKMFNSLEDSNKTDYNKILRYLKNNVNDKQFFKDIKHLYK